MRSSRFPFRLWPAPPRARANIFIGAQQKRLISQAALIAIVENHKGAVLRYIDAAPDSMLGFRPTKGVRNFAEQIEHAAGSDALIAQLAITGSTKGIPPFGDSAAYLHDKAALKKYSAAAMDYTIKMLRASATRPWRRTSCSSATRSRAPAR